MTAVAEQTLEISVEAECAAPRDGCRAHAQNLLDILDNGRYDRCAVMKIPASIEEWMDAHRTARKRAARAARKGYRVDIVQRHLHVDEIYEINLSKPERQGRPMSAAYHERPSDTPLQAFACDRHAIRTYGVTHPDGFLVAYLWMYRAGELALVSSILGHADYESESIMYLLFAGALKVEICHGPGVVVYNRWDSGTDGLRFLKARLGFEERQVKWCP